MPRWPKSLSTRAPKMLFHSGTPWQSHLSHWHSSSFPQAPPTPSPSPFSVPHITPNCRSIFFPLTSLLLLLLHDKGEDSASSPHLLLFFSLFLLSLFLLCHHKLHPNPYIYLLLIFLPSPCISVPLLQSHNLYPGPHPHTGLLPLSPPLWLLIQDPGRSQFSSGPSRVARLMSLSPSRIYPK